MNNFKRYKGESSKVFFYIFLSLRKCEVRVRGRCDICCTFFKISFKLRFVLLSPTNYIDHIIFFSYLGSGGFLRLP